VVSKLYVLVLLSEYKLISSDVKLLPTRWLGIIRIQRGLLMLLLRLERDFGYDAYIFVQKRK